MEHAYGLDQEILDLEGVEKKSSGIVMQLSFLNAEKSCNSTTHSYTLAKVCLSVSEETIKY